MTSFPLRRDGTSSTNKNLSSRFIVLVLFGLALFEVVRNFDQLRKVSYATTVDPSVHFDLPTTWSAVPRSTARPKKTTVAYAISVTDYQPDSVLLDRAAVLHQSIKVAMRQSLRYDYHVYAFVHTDAAAIRPWLERLGYRVEVKETPFDITKVNNSALVDAQRIGCCKEKEYLKLYSYLLLDYPVVVHLDLDTIVLKPMEEIFDFFAGTQPNTTQTISKETVEAFANTSSMWMNKPEYPTSWSHAHQSILERPEGINFMFTRDYNMVDPRNKKDDKKPYQIGVQGGFLVIRPNRRDFDNLVEILQNGGDGYNEGTEGWGGKYGKNLGYEGYYGVATIQGLASYYYDFRENATASLELNRCHYNTMVDEPRHFYDEKDKRNGPSICRTLEADCQDCRETNPAAIYTAHFTVCGKPDWCADMDPGEYPMHKVCRYLFREWHRTRLSLEMEWMQRFALGNDNHTILPYVPKLHGNPITSRDHHKSSFKLGHCDGTTYLRLELPEESSPGADVLIREGQ